MNCPRCGLDLAKDRYEGHDVLVCKECWGYWLDRGEFAGITARREYAFTEEERRQLAERARALAKRDDAPVPCPRCAKTMERVHLDVAAPLTVDRCPSHGIWLDTHELKLAQVLAEDAAAVRRLFFEKLKE